MSLTDETLAPCPFCGLEYQGHFQWPGGAWTWYTVPDKHHNGCPLRGENYATEAELIAAWNTRHSASPTTLTDEMIDAGAKQIVMVGDDWAKLRSTWDDMPEYARDHYRDQARACYLAMHSASPTNSDAPK